MRACIPTLSSYLSLSLSLSLSSYLPIFLPSAIASNSPLATCGISLPARLASGLAPTSLRRTGSRQYSRYLIRGRQPCRAHNTAASRARANQSATAARSPTRRYRSGAVTGRPGHRAGVTPATAAPNTGRATWGCAQTLARPGTCGQTVTTASRQHHNFTT